MCDSGQGGTMKKLIHKIILLVFVMSILIFPACAKKAGNCPAKEKAVESIKRLMPIRFDVASISESKQIPGICEIVIELDKDHPVIFYMDKTGEYIFSGSIVRTKDKTDITQKRLEEYKKKK